MPAYNEAGIIQTTVAQALAALAELGREGEVVIVDDGSADETVAICLAIAERDVRVRVVTHGGNRGFSAAWRSCVASAKGDWVFVAPSDGQVPPATALRFLRERADADIVIGVRPQSSGADFRRLLSGIYARVVRFTFGLPYRDFSTCFLYRTALVQALPVRSRDRAATYFPEVLFLARRRGARIAEMRFLLRPRTAGEAKGARLGVLVRTGLEVLRLALVHRIRPEADAQALRDYASVRDR